MLIFSNLASWGCFKGLQKYNINSKGITRSFFFIGVLFTLASVAASGVDKGFTCHKLDVGYKIAASFQIVSCTLGALYLALALIADSIPPLDNFMEKTGRAIFIATGAIMMLLNVVAVILYPVLRMTVKNDKSAGDTSDPTYSIWQGLLITGTIFIGPSIMATVMFGKKKQAEGNEYQQVINA